MIKTEFMNLYEELNSLNEEVLEEGFITDFSKIPAEDLLTKCIIDGKPWPINFDDHSKDGVVPFYTALNYIVNIIKSMNDKNKAEFTLDWIAIGSVKDLSQRTYAKNLEYKVAVKMANDELNRVIQQVGSDETELSSLQKLPILLKSNIIMCCRPSSALEESKEEEMGNIVVYLGGVGKLAPYYNDIQKAFKQIKNAYEGGFLSKVAKFFKREDLEIDELDTLNEAVSPEAKAFYDSLKNRGPVDTESFIKAFKKDIPDNIWDQLFDANMKLKHRGTYGTIKNENLPADVTAALKKYWAFQYASNISYFETTTMINKKEEAKRKEEEEKLAKVKVYTEKAERVLSLIDKEATQKLIQLSKEVEPERAKDITETPEIYVNSPAVGIEFYKFLIYVYRGNYSLSEKEPTEQELVDKFNSNVSRHIANLEEIKSLKLAKQNRQEKYTNAKWYSEEFEEWASTNKEGIFLFKLSDDEGIQRLTRLSWDLVERCHFTDDVELIAVVTDYDPPMRNPYSATENSYYYRYYSVNSKADPADLEDEGILLDPSKFVDDSSWGQKTYEEVSAESAKRSPSHYFINGMDKWFEYESVSYGTD